MVTTDSAPAQAAAAPRALTTSFERTSLKGWRRPTRQSGGTLFPAVARSLDEASLELRMFLMSRAA